jgi:enterochelin esterase-like enzyme
MPVCAVNYYSRSLGMSADMQVLVPEGDGPFGVLYLLHGLGGDHTMYTRCLPLPLLTERRHMILALCNGGKSYYCNGPAPAGLAYEDHIVRDTVGFVDRTFRTIPDRAHRVVAGLSMGGYGAMMLGLKHADVFGALSSMSGSLYFAAEEHPKGEQYPTQLMNALPPNVYNCFELARTVKAAGSDLAIRFDCGRQDFLYDVNRRFHEHLTAIGLAHEFLEYDGAHDWKYWSAHVGETLDFAEQHLWNP